MPNNYDLKEKKSTSDEDRFDYNARDCISERALWQSVIMQAILDISKEPIDARQKSERLKTIAWFSPKNQDFMLVCSFADLDSKMVLRGHYRALKIYEANRKNKRKVKHRGATKNKAEKVSEQCSDLKKMLKL